MIKVFEPNSSYPSRYLPLDESTVKNLHKLLTKVNILTKEHKEFFVYTESLPKTYMSRDCKIERRRKITDLVVLSDRYVYDLTYKWSRVIKLTNLRKVNDDEYVNDGTGTYEFLVDRYSNNKFFTEEDLEVIKMIEKEDRDIITSQFFFNTFSNIPFPEDRIEAYQLFRSMRDYELRDRLLGLYNPVFSAQFGTKSNRKMARYLRHDARGNYLEPLKIVKTWS